MFRTFIIAAALFFVSFAAEALPPNFDRTLCVTAVFDAGKVTKCAAEAAKMRKEKGEIVSAVVTCKMYSVPDRRLNCANYAVDHLDVDREKVRGACHIISDAKTDFKSNCLMQHLMLEDRERREEQKAQQAPTAPARGGGSVR